jgi:hypothetical protein
MGAFFLTLALAFNDLKTLVWTQHLLVQGKPPPWEWDDPTPRNGQINGMLVHLSRYGIGLLEELRVFLRNNRSLVESADFQQLPFTAAGRKSWDNLCALAFGGQTPFLKSLVSARNVAAFHYGQGDLLPDGFIEHFRTQTEDERFKHAFISVGVTMEAIRFYYADAAVVKALELTGVRRLEPEFLARVGKELDELNRSLAGALVAFLKSRGVPVPSLEE